MNKRQAVLNLINPDQKPGYTPAAFFLHFGPDFQAGQAAVEKHLAYFNFTGMDFVKIQFEHHFPAMPALQKPEDWARVPVYQAEFFDAPLKIIDGLVKAVDGEALIVQTLYSPFMLSSQIAPAELVMQSIRENPQAYKQGIASITESLLNFIREAKRRGIDGFYTSTQGGEGRRFEETSPDQSLAMFTECIKPYDLDFMHEANQGTLFNILHICDYHLPYTDLTRFVDYPGQVVNANLEMENGEVTPQEVEKLFHRPFMGGMDRLGVIATGTPDQVRAAASEVLDRAPARFILAADCTVPGTTPWENLQAAIDTAHHRHIN